MNSETRPPAPGQADVIYFAPHHDRAARCLPGLQRAGANLGRIRWNAEPLAMTAADFSDEQNVGIKFAIGAAWLRGLLSQGPRRKEEIDQLASQVGISPTLLRNLRSELGIKLKKSGFQGKTLWRLPIAAQPESVPEVHKIGEGGARLEETGGISNVEGGAVPPKV